MANARKHIALVAVLSTACSTAPVSYFGAAPPGRETAYQCAVAQLNIMDYTIEDGNQDTGFVRGRKHTSDDHRDVLTASAFDHPATRETNLRVTATRIEIGDAGVEKEVAPSGTGLADAQALLANCGVGHISRPLPDGDGGLRPEPATPVLRLTGGATAPNLLPWGHVPTHSERKVNEARE